MTKITDIPPLMFIVAMIYFLFLNLVRPTIKSVSYENQEVDCSGGEYIEKGIIKVRINRQILNKKVKIYGVVP